MQASGPAGGACRAGPPDLVGVLGDKTVPGVKRSPYGAAKAAGKPFFLMANSQDPHRPFAGSLQERNKVRKSRKNKKSKNKTNRQKDLALAPIPRRYDPKQVPVPGFLADLPEIRQELSEYYASVHRADQIVGGVLKALDEAGLSNSTLVMFLSDHGMPLPFAKTNCWRHSTRTPWIIRWPGVVRPGNHDRQHMVAGIDLAPTILDAVGRCLNWAIGDGL